MLILHARLREPIRELQLRCEWAGPSGTGLRGLHANANAAPPPSSGLCELLACSAQRSFCSAGTEEVQQALETIMRFSKEPEQNGEHSSAP